MNEDSTLDKVEKVARKFLKWIPIFALLLIILGGGYYAYQTMGIGDGIREYRAVLAYINSLSGNDMDYFKRNFYAKNPDLNLYGGILAGSWKYGIWLWGENGLKYFSINQASSFSIVRKCQSALEYLSARNYKNVDPSKLAKMEISPNIYDWNSKVRPGTYVQVAAAKNNNNKIISVSAVPEFKKPEDGIICSAYIKQ